jgi:hypothetical protein
MTDDLPGVLQLIPEEVVERRYSAGERLEAGLWEVGQELSQGDVPTTPRDAIPGNE